jgi:hypothetical protein
MGLKQGGAKDYVPHWIDLSATALHGYGTEGVAYRAKNTAFWFTMTNEEWIHSNSASEMLAKLQQTQPSFLKSQIPNLHRFFIACCWKHSNLIPQVRLAERPVRCRKVD